MCGERRHYSRLKTRQRMAKHEKEVIKELTQLIHAKGKCILTGECKLSLTSVSLSILNDRFKKLPENDDGSTWTEPRVSDPESHKDSLEDIKFLYDFLRRISSLKVIHGSSTIQGQVCLHHFKNLQCLEVKKVPVHLLEGLHHLRSTLKALIASRCLQNLQDLFECCGGDMSSAQSWPLMKTVCLSNNNLETLDGSLRLLPSLEVIDLSFNQLSSMDGYLEYLTELLHVNLAFNRLEQIPTFALRVRHQLRTLILRNNNLDNIDGIEELGELQELDLSHNCLCDHSKLHLLCYLHKLHTLNLLGNPICYHVNHRRLAIQFLSPIAAKEVNQQNKQILVDGKPVSNIEALYIPKNPVHYRKGSYIPSAFADIHLRVNQQLRGSAETLPEDSEGDLSTSSSSKGRKSKKKARRVVISDFESSTEFSSREPSRANTPRAPEESLDISSIKSGLEGTLSREEIETTRKQLGPGWLVSLTARQEHYQEQKQDEQVLNINNQPGDQILLKDGTKTHDDYFLNDDLTTASTPPVEEDDGIIVILPKDGATTTQVTSKTEQRSELSIQRSISSGMTWDGEEEEEEQETTDGDPFIVNLEDEDNTQIIVIIGERFLWEKDITGDILEKLDLKLLQGLEKCETSRSDFGVKLSFEYLRRDRQARMYKLEDAEQLELFCQHLEVHMQARQEATKFKDMLHCLKCEAQFHKTLSIEPTDSFEFHADGQVKDAGYQCPQCKSTMVVELDIEQITQARGAGQETPVGSLKSLSAKGPLAASSTQTSPVRFGRDIPNESKDTDSFQSCPETYSSFKSAGDITPMYQSPKSGDDSFAPKYVTANSSLGENSFSTSPREVPENKNSSNFADGNNASISSKGLVRNKSVPTSLSLTKSETGSSPRPIGTKSSSSRNRIDSGESDITVISNPSQSSITVLRNPSQDVVDADNTLTYNSGMRQTATMSPVADRSLSMDEGAQLMKKFADDREKDSGGEVDGETTPYGSLTNQTVSSMINSVYEFTKNSPGGASLNSGSRTPDKMFDDVNVYGANLKVDIPSDNVSIKSNDSAYSTHATFKSYVSNDSKVLNDSKFSSLTKQAADSIVYNYEDYSQVDHRLKLWLSMNLFEDSEECQALLRCGVVQYMIPEEYPALLVTTDKRIYIVKITGQEKNDPADWLKCTETQPITELQYVDIGYNYQSFRLEFSTDFSSYTCLVRDERRCKLFMAMFTGVIQSGSLSTHSKLEGITKNFSETLEHLREQVLLMSEPEDSFLEDDLEVRQFMAGYLQEDETKVEKPKKGSAENTPKPVTIITTSALICLANQNYQWPLPRLQGPIGENVKMTEFSLIDKKHINEIAQVSLYVENPNLLLLEFFEDDNESADLCCWEVIFETKDSLDKLVDSIKEPWETAFSVPLTIVQVTSAMTPDS